MNRRAVLAGVPTALLLGGCTDLLPGNEHRFEADTAVVSEQARSETGYGETGIDEQRIEREYDRIDQTVVIVNVLAEYSREVGIGPIGGELARFTVLSTPKVEVGPVGPLNPVDEMDNDEVAETVQNEYGRVRNFETVDDREGSLLGETVTVTKYGAEARTQAGQGVDVFVQIAQVESGDDFVVTVGVHPRDVDEQAEQERVDTMMAGVEHPVSTGTDEGGTDDNSSS